MWSKLARMMGLIIAIGFLVLAALSLVGDATYVATPLYDTVLPAAQSTTIAIAAPEQALTFARVRNAGQPYILLVRSYRDGTLEGINLNAALATSETNPSVLFNTVGYAAIQQLAAQDAPLLRATVADLLIPFDTHDHHIALGTNYPEHGDEVDIETPFLFPKIAPVSHFTSNVARGDALLDYEVELGLLMLQDQAVDAPLPPYLGFLLVNDFTDRERLMRRINLFDVESGIGFTEAKSRPDFLPVGNLLVIPHDWADFLAQIELTLSVNGQVRQRDRSTSMIWQPAQIMRELAARRGRTFPYNGQMVALLAADGVIPQGTIILTGTPAGVVFRPPGARQIMAGIPPYVLGFKWTTQSPLDAYLRGAHESGAFLQPGDEVSIRADYLGVLQNHIVP